MKPTVPGSFPEVIDSTIRAEFVSCPTKAYYSFFRRLGGKAASTDLIAGGAFARGLEVTRKLFYGSKMPLPEALEQGMLEAIVAYGDHAPNEKKQNKSVERVVQALEYYFTEYPPAEDHIQPYFSGGEPAVEFTFSVPLPINHPETGAPILYAGRFDMVGLYQGQLIGVDEKTTSQLGDSWAPQWNLRGQFTGYCWALHQHNLPVIGMAVRGIAFKKYDFDDKEVIQLRPKWMIDAWYEQLLADIERMKQSYLTGWYDQDFNHTCAEFGGCQFQALCTSQTPELWIEGRYAEREWNPLAKVPYEQPKQEVEVVHDPLLANLGV